MAALPLSISASGIAWDSGVCLALLAISIFAAVSMVPGFRHRESLGISILVAICAIPSNIRISYYCVHELLYLNVLGEILYFIICYLVLFSIEEIIFGIIARLIWKKQYRFSFLSGKDTKEED